MFAREPRRHLPGEHGGFHRLGPGAGVLVGQKRHGRGFARPMTSLAIPLQNRQHVFVKSNGLRGTESRQRQAEDEQAHGDLRLFNCTYWATNPPSMGRAWPVMNDARSEHNQTTALATSCGWPTRPMGWRLARNSETPPKARVTMSVSMMAGPTALTRIPDLPYSMAAALV